MARKLSTLNKGRSVNRKPVKSKGSGSSEYDWDELTEEWRHQVTMRKEANDITL